MVAALRIFNPDGSEAELSGNGVREAVMYLRRHGWADSDTFSLHDGRRRGPPADHRPDDLHGGHGPGDADLEGLPLGRGRRDAARVEAGGRELAFQHVSIGNPQCAIEWERRPGGAGAGAAGRADRAPRAVSQPHQRVVLAPDRRRRDPRADLRARGGGDDVLGHRRDRRRRGRGAARRRQPGDRPPGRRRPGGGGRRRPARGPDRLGRARVRGARAGATSWRNSWRR